MRTIINVANRLPVTIGETLRKSSGGLVSALEGVSQERFHLKWLGWPGAPFDTPEACAEVERRLAEELGYTPVFLSTQEVENYYDGFANGSLWPILHYNPQLMEYDGEQWDTYRDVNQRFADKILEIAGDDDLIWVHDYHLMLVPKFLRQARPGLRVGFFFHTPFPSSEVFRSHPRRSELLDGVIGADQIGFHTYGYLRHFRSAVLRALGLETDLGSIRHGNHMTTVGVYPIGINSGSFTEQLASETFQQRCEELRTHWKGRRLVLSVERLDYSKGVIQRLHAIEQFLQYDPDAGNVVFLFINVPSREKVQAYKDLLNQIESEVGRINGLYATIENAPIHFVHQSVDFTELCALYTISEVALVTPLVDGMNLVAKEFLACQTDDDPGVLVLSEFAGAAQELVNALIVNPFNTTQMSMTISQALNMPHAERLERVQKMRARVMEFDADFWARTFIDDLCKVEQFTQSTVEFTEVEDAIRTRLRKATNPAFFLDYDGTLREFETVPTAASPNTQVREVMDALNASKVDIYIISGRNPEILAEWFQGYPFTLIAEHGSAVLTPGTEDWVNLNQATDFSWKEPLLEVLRHYEGSTPGSFVEVKKSAIVWHYRQCDPEFGVWKARQLLDELYEMTSNYPVEVHHGKKIVEISSIHVNKGAALERFANENNYDMVLCAGDDQTDETMFRVERDGLVTIKVGEGDTRAVYRVPDPEHVRTMLLRLVR